MRLMNYLNDGGGGGDRVQMLGQRARWSEAVIISSSIIDLRISNMILNIISMMMNMMLMTMMTMMKKKNMMMMISL